MKTTELFNQINEIVDCALKSVFDYSINKNEYFYEIHLYEEPTKGIEDICEKNGFSISMNNIHVNEGGNMVAKLIWEVKPTEANDIEYVEA